MERSSRSWLWSILSIGLFLCGLSGCSREPLPELISVTDALPREVEVGDRLEIVGAGLPEGRVARVTFRGDLHRPGEAATHDAEIVTEGNVTAADRVEIPYTAELEAEFCGAGNEAVHTTFAGAVEVAFTATFVGAPPVAATLAHTTIDFRPPLRASSNAAAEAERLFAFAGIHVADSAARASGVGIESVDPDSRAQAAGLLDGDEIVSFNDVRVLSTADVAAIGGEPVAAVRVRRAGGVDTTVHLHLDGFRPAPAVDRFAFVVLLALFVGALAVRFSPASRWLVAFAHRTHAASGPIAGWSTKYGVWWSSVAICVVLLSVPCAADFFGARADAPTVFGAVTLLSVLVALASRGAVDAGRVALWQLLSACSVAGVVLLSGSLRVDEIASTEGALPWSWCAFRGPAGVALFSVYALSLIASTVRTNSARDFSSYVASSPSVPPLGAADAFRLALASSLAAPLFLGGGRLASSVPHAFAFAVALSKAGALFAGAAYLRSVLPVRLRFRELAPAAAIALAITFAQMALGLDRRVETIVDLTTCAIVLFGALHAFSRARSLMRPSETVPLRPSPFL